MQRWIPQQILLCWVGAHHMILIIIKVENSGAGATM